MHVALKYVSVLSSCAALVATIAFAAGSAQSPPRTSTPLKVPGGLAFSEFKGYEDWQVISVSHRDKAIAVILGNPAMIQAYQAGIPANGKPVPDGAKMAKIHSVPKKNQYFPDATVAGVQHDVDFMVKDSKRFGRRRGMGLCRVQVRCRDRYVHARHNG